jgi:hypothetical protein
MTPTLLTAVLWIAFVAYWLMAGREANCTAQERQPAAASRTQPSQAQHLAGPAGSA